MAVALVCFDLGGVLVHHRRDLADVFDAAGLPPPDPQWLESSAFVGALAQLAADHESGRITTDAFVRAVSEQSEGLLTEDDVRRLHRATVGEQLPDVQPIIERLVRSDQRIAVLSNNNPVHWPELTGGAYPAVALIPERLASHQLRLMKPDPAIFSEAARRFGVAPGEILLLDDSPANVESARAEGWNAVRIDPARPVAPQIERALTEYRVKGFT